MPEMIARTRFKAGAERFREHIFRERGMADGNSDDRSGSQEEDSGNDEAVCKAPVRRRFISSGKGSYLL